MDWMFKARKLQAGHRVENAQIKRSAIGTAHTCGLASAAPVAPDGGWPFGGGHIPMEKIDCPRGSRSLRGGRAAFLVPASSGLRFRPPVLRASSTGTSFPSMERNGQNPNDGTGPTSTLASGRYFVAPCSSTNGATGHPIWTSEGSCGVQARRVGSG